MAPLKLHPVAPLLAVQLLPVILAFPGETPFMVDTETVAKEVLLELKFPPLHPAGAEAVLVPPTAIEPEDKDTLPAGQGTADTTN